MNISLMNKHCPWSITLTIQFTSPHAAYWKTLCMYTETIKGENVMYSRKAVAVEIIVEKKRFIWYGKDCVSSFHPYIAFCSNNAFMIGANEHAISVLYLGNL